MATSSLLRSRRQRPHPDAMTLVEHIAELRTRVMVSAFAFLVTAVVAFVFYPQILGWLKSPYCTVAGTHHCALYVTSPIDGLALRVKIAAYGGLFLASPVILFELWRFITPGLRANERRYAVSFVGASIVFFGFGCILAYLVFPHALQWLGSIGGPSLVEIYDPNKYLGLIVALMALFGVSFEFPVVLVALELAGVLTPQRLASWRRWAIVAITAAAGILTPSSDPFSMLGMAVPMVVFYELAILVGRIVVRRRRRRVATGTATG